MSNRINVVLLAIVGFFSIGAFTAGYSLSERRFSTAKNDREVVGDELIKTFHESRQGGQGDSASLGDPLTRVETAKHSNVTARGAAPGRYSNDERKIHSRDEVISGHGVSGASILHQSDLINESDRADEISSNPLWEMKSFRDDFMAFVKWQHQQDQPPWDGEQFQILSELGGDGFTLVGRQFRPRSSPELSLSWYEFEYAKGEMANITPESRKVALDLLCEFEKEETQLINRILARVRKGPVGMTEVKNVQCYGMKDGEFSWSIEGDFQLATSKTMEERWRVLIVDAKKILGL